MKKTVIYALFAGALLAAGCAKNATISTGENARSYLELWMNEYHPAVSQSPSGIYILEDKEGTGAVWDSNQEYSFLITTIRGLNGKVTSTAHEDVAKQLGTYSRGNYYGATVSSTKSGYAGVETVLQGMRKGGTRTAVIPSWLLTTDRHSTQKEYIDACTSSTHLIYTITFTDQTSDVDEWEEKTLRNYVTANFGSSVETTSFNDESANGDYFYFISDNSGISGDAPVEAGKKYKLNYTGMLLNGQVFDTTLEKVAKDNGIYNSSKTYEPVTITFADSYESIAMGGSSNLVDGFKGALSMLRFPGQKASALFTSNLGYKNSGSGSTIPAYAPLRFELEFVALTETD
ncbi:MAG: FKBP-type peptidyl-prolyl cis-trans isomerase [Bacteroidales bacterium]|nr:FKBP-type peptidyl-prolyl cis-trans isomerase [Bacteroidales bacterium]